MKVIITSGSVAYKINIKMKIKHILLVIGVCCTLLEGKSQTTNAYKQPDRITLTWSDDPSQTQSVSWRVNADKTKMIGQVVEELSNPELEAKAISVQGIGVSLEQGQQTDTYGQVTFRDLKPGTVYAYRVGDGTIWSPWNQFRTA